MRKRFEYVDIAKGFGIVLVVCSHTDALSMMWLFMGMFVPIFYFCSGYTYSMKYSLKVSIYNRFRRLLVPYLFFNALMFCAFWHFSIRELLGVIYSRYCLYPLEETPNIKFLTSGNYPMWFLTSMFVSYLLFLLIVQYEKNRNYIITSYILLTFLLQYCPILLPWSIDTAFLTSLFMYAGMKVRKNKWIDTFRLWQIVLLGLIYIVFQIEGGDINISVRMYGTSIMIYLFMGILGSVVVLWISRHFEKTIIGKLFGELGRHSLCIFCIEVFFIVWTKELYSILWPDVTLGHIAGIIEIIAALLGGWLVSKLIHRSRSLTHLVFAS